MALSEAVKEVMFVIQLVGSMKILVKLPVTVKVANVGATFMASNINTMLCTKHVDIRYKFLNECVEYVIIKTIFVKSAENNSDKNLNAQLNKKHSMKIEGEKLEDVSIFRNL